MDMQAILDDIAQEMAAATDRGRVADYIPELAGIDPNQFAISVCLADGREFNAGDTGVIPSTRPPS